MSIAQYVMDDARLNQIQLTHNMADELSLRRPHRADVPGQYKCESYESCVLLPPRHVGAIEAPLIKKILAALATRFNTSVSAIQPHVAPHAVKQFGKIRYLDSDTVVASALAKPHNDTRDATFVRYEVFVDKYARQQQREPELERKTSFGQLQHVFVIELPPIIPLKLLEPTTVVLVGINPCLGEAFDSYGIRYYSKLGPLGIVDAMCVQCVVGRVRAASKLWAIIDRTSHVCNAPWSEETQNI